MSPLLLAQLACVAMRDSDAVGGDPYAWPPRPPLPEEERREMERLRVLGARLMYRAREGGITDTSAYALFGGDDGENA